MTTAGKTTRDTYFMAALPWTVPVGDLAGATFGWTATFLVDTSGVDVSQWNAAAAVYDTTSPDPKATIPSDFNLLQVKPTDNNTGPAPYNNNDRAGTPEAIKTFVIAGTLGNGGTAYTGGYTGNQNPTALLVPAINPVDPTDTFQTDAVPQPLGTAGNSDSETAVVADDAVGGAGGRRLLCVG